jgi:hypothetical protein
MQLDRRFQLDWRSLDYPVDAALALRATTPTYRPRSYSWALRTWLDQGTEGACVGFAFAHDLAARPAEVKNLTRAYAVGLYHDAQRIDEWAGGAYPGANPFYEGTSVLAGAKVCTTRGFYSSYYWGLSLEEVARGVAYFGPAVLGLDWYEGMLEPDSNGFIHPSGRWVGGHAIVAVGIQVHYKRGVLNWFRRTWNDVDLDRSYLTLHNSWGPGWGKNGRARLSLSDFNKLLGANGEACFPVRTRKVTP